MSGDYAHLHPSARQWAFEDEASRIRRIRTDRWIAYALADTALEALEDLLSFPKRTRMPNLLIVGPTNNGKTMIVEKFRRSHSPTPARDMEDGIAEMPVVRVQMPAGPDERRFFGAILEAMGLTPMPNETVSARQQGAMTLMRSLGVRMLVIDELHNVLSGAPLQQRRLLNLLRWIGNELQIPLVGVGTAEALRAIRSDDQLVNRFEPLPLPPWKNDEAYRRLLATLEAVLPLRRPSNLTGAAMRSHILAAAEGVLGEIVALVSRSAVAAVRSGDEMISLRHIENAGFVRPSHRRQLAI